MIKKLTAGEFEWISQLPKDLIHLPLEYTWVVPPIVAAMVVVVVVVEIVGVEVVIEVTMVVEVTVVDTVVAHPLLTTDPDPDVITDHALGLIVLVDTKS